jgi:AraC-like DNA-binding protein
MKLGHERRSGNEFITRHMHPEGSVALVISGGYEEAGDRGRFHVRAGDVVIHAPYDTHLDRFTSSGARILNLPITSRSGFSSGFGHIDNPDLIARVAERDLAQATELLFSAFEEHSSFALDWPEQLAQALSKHPELCLGDWAHEFGFAAATVTRGFKQVFGITPSQFRAHSRAKLAWNMIHSSNVPLCHVASSLGFSDQAHMTRALRSLTGKTPSMCRTQGQMDSRQLDCCHL